MRLVEIDNDHAGGNFNQNNAIFTQSIPIPDDIYTKPTQLSMLDNQMNEVLSKKNVNDFDKWRQYNQILQRYLKSVQNVNNQSYHRNDESQSKQQNVSLDQFDNMYSPFNMSGVLPIRDSIDAIEAPRVREFFEQIRESLPTDREDLMELSAQVTSAPSTTHSLPTPPHRPVIEPMRLRQRVVRKDQPVIRKRAFKRKAESGISFVKPCKVALRRSFVERWKQCNLPP